MYASGVRCLVSKTSTARSPLHDGQHSRSRKRYCIRFSSPLVEVPSFSDHIKIPTRKPLTFAYAALDHLAARARVPHFLGDPEVRQTYSCQIHAMSFLFTNFSSIAVSLSKIQIRTPETLPALPFLVIRGFLFQTQTFLAQEIIPYHLSMRPIPTECRMAPHATLGLSAGSYKSRVSRSLPISFLY